MRERLGASEAEIERVDDDDSSARGSGATAASAAGGNKEQRKRAISKAVENSESEEDDDDDDDNDDHDDDNDDDEDGDEEEEEEDGGESRAGALKTKQGKTAGRGKDVAKQPAKRTTAMIIEDGDLAAPDMVEDLGAWSDDEEW